MSIVDWIFPRLCVGCGREGQYICGDCQRQLILPQQICPMCSQPSLDGWTHPRCMKGLGMERLIVGLSYRGLVQNCLKKVKYQSAWEIVSFLWELSGDRASSDLRSHRPGDVIASVPMWSGKERARGFNQAEMIGKLVADKYEIPFEPLLVRVRNTLPMFGLTKEKRSDNIRNAFSCHHKLSNCGRVMLVDDVWTTGSTMRECARMLKYNGAREVWGITLAK